MAKNAAFFVFVVASVLLLLASQAEIVAAQCQSFDISKVVACRSDLGGTTCSATCKAALDPYANTSDQCICSFVDKAAAYIPRAQITSVLKRCYPTRTLPCL